LYVLCAIALVIGQQAATPVQLTLTLAKSTIEAGTDPTGKITLHNVSGQPITFCTGLDGSYRGARYPHMFVLTRRDGGDWARLDLLPGCGNMDPIWEQAFVNVKAGERKEFVEVYRRGIECYKAFKEPGVVQLKFAYDSSSAKIADWQGDERGTVPSKKVAALFAKVWRGRCESNVVSVRVVPKVR
jgi:hypothetical protein